MNPIKIIEFKNCKLYLGNKKNIETVILVYFIFLINTIYVSIFEGIYIIKYLSQSLLIIDLIIFLLAFYNFISCHITEPGIIPKGNIEYNESENHIEPTGKDRFYKERYCNSCKIMRPPKASHCRDCDRCIKKFDHHCYFIANCVGERNWNNFILFLFFSSCVLIFRISVSIVIIIDIFDKFKDLNEFFFEEKELLITAIILLGLGICFMMICRLRIECYSLLFLVGIILVCVSCGIAIKKIENISFYEYPIFAFINICSLFPFIFWVIPLAIMNCFNAMNFVTTKEKRVLDEVIFEDGENALYQSFTLKQKIYNMIRVLCSKTTKSEIL